MTTQELRENIKELHIKMFQVAFDMDRYGDEETKEHAQELYGASKICKEWSDKAKTEGKTS